MNKLFLLTVISLMTISSHAQVTFDEETPQKDEQGVQQEENPFGENAFPDKRKNVVSLGITAGANMSTMSKYDPVDLGLKSGIGFQGGLIIAAHFGKRTQGSDAGTGLFGFQIEPSYVQHTVGTNSDDIKLSCIEVPVLLKIYVTPNFNIEIGPNLCGTLSSSPETLTAGNNIISIGDLKSYDIKACLGASYETKNGLYASLRYNLGTSKLAKNFDSKISAASLTIGYKFNIFKF